MKQQERSFSGHFEPTEAAATSCTEWGSSPASVLSRCSGLLSAIACVAVYEEGPGEQGRGSRGRYSEQ